MLSGRIGLVIFQTYRCKRIGYFRGFERQAMIKHFSLSLLLGVVLLGCATRPVSNSEAVHVSNAQVLDSTYLKPIPNSGVVTIKRDRGVGGSVCSSRVFVNAKPIADLNASEKVVIYLPVG